MFIYLIKSKDRNIYNSFLENSFCPYVHQSLEWVEFQRSLNSRENAEIIAVLEEKNNLSTMRLTCAYVLIKTIFGKNYMHINRGPVLNKNLLKNSKREEILKKFKEEILRVAKKNNCIFIRTDFPFSIDFKSKFLKDNLTNTKKAHATFQPKRTLLLDLSKTLDDLQKEMKSKGRYNIRLAAKKGVKIKVSTNIKDIEKFYEISKTTANRDGFFIQPLEFYKSMITKLMPNNSAKIYLAEVNDEVIAANIIIFFAKTVTYYYGASSNKYRNLMAPYLLQWQSISDAKKAGFKYYDFLGIAENNDPKHSWAGITSFKRKFGGQDLNYWKPREIVLKPFLYYTIVSVKFFKKLLKKF